MAEVQIIFRVKLVYLISRKIFSEKVPDPKNELQLWIMFHFQVEIRYAVLLLLGSLSTADGKSLR